MSDWAENLTLFAEIFVGMAVSASFCIGIYYGIYDGYQHFLMSIILFMTTILFFYVNNYRKRNQNKANLVWGLSLSNVLLICAAINTYVWEDVIC